MNKLPHDIESRLRAAAPAGIGFRCKSDLKGVTTAWCTLASAADLLAAASLLKTIGARLSTLTIFQPTAPEAPELEEGQEAPPPPTFLGGLVNDGTPYEIAYHFDVDGDTLSLVVHLPAGGEVESLTPLFRNADWPEREAMEIYSVVVRGHPDPRRLFLDPGIDGAVLERLIPLSTLASAASTKGLWEKILAQTGGTA